jgi:signal transduction histidine kinase
MAVYISCPNCAKPVDLQTRYCEHCGVDVVFAAAVAERSVISPTQVPAGVPLAPEILVPRMGDTMLEQAIIQPEQLQRALEYQKKRAEEGHPVLLGQALLELGLVTREALDQVITVQILQLQNALNDSNRQLEQRVQERTADLQRALERLSELTQLKSNFIANISHELRTPLTHLKGYLDILAHAGLGAMNPQQTDVLAILQRAETRLERLIEDLIQFSLASRGELNIKLSSFHLADMIQLTLDRSGDKATTGAINLSVNLPLDLPQVRADEEKIGWVLSQLVDNALKFTPKGGRVEIGAVLESSLVTVAVTDTGIGIPQERLEEIFEPFHQLDGSATRRFGGTGLGLAMAQRIIEAHGSKINVESILGLGSLFEFSLPVMKAETEPIEVAVNHNA